LSRILILGAGTAQAEFIQHCLANGHEVHLADGNKDAISNGISHNNLKIETLDITNPEEVLSYAKRIIPEAVIAPSNDAGLISATLVAEHMGIPGPGIFATQNSRNKFLFRNLLKSAGFTTPWFMQVNKSNIEGLSAEIPSYPCVIKPVQGSGSVGVRYLATASDLDSYIHGSLKDTPYLDYQIEEFVEGVEFSIEGIVQNGNLEILAICEKERSKLPNLVDTRVIYPPKLPVNDLVMAHATARKIVQTLQVQNAPIHLEFIQSPKLGFVAVECAVRAAGFNLFNRMVPWCTGVDTLELQLDLILGQRLRNIARTRQYSGILDFPQPTHRGILKAINYQKSEDADSVTQIEIYKKIGDLVAPARNGAERIGHIFIFAKTYIQAEKIFNSLNFSIELEDLSNKDILAETDQN
jgi:biotin carboxylase